MQAIHTLTKSCLVAGLLFTASFHASAATDVPELINYQATVTDDAGQPIGATEAVERDIIFRVFDQANGGSILWSERQTVTIFQGNFNTLLGTGIQEGTEPRGSLPDLFGATAGGSSADRFIEITLINGSTVQTFLPRQRFVANPYAFKASFAEVAREVQTDGLGLNLDSSLTVPTNLNVSGNIDNPAGGQRVKITDSEGLQVSNNASVGSLNVNGSSTMSGPMTMSGAGSHFTLNKQQLRLAGFGDGNHVLRYAGTGLPFANQLPDGPALYGHQGGILGTNFNNERAALRWDWRGNVDIFGPTTINGDLAVSGNGSNLYLNDRGLYLRAYGDFSSGLRYTLNGFGNHPGLDGPALFGFRGGLLGTTSGNPHVALSWDQGGVTVTGRLAFRTGSSNTGFIETVTYRAYNGVLVDNALVLGSSGAQFSNGSNVAVFDGDSNWDFYSDRRLKTAIADAEPILDRLKKLRFRNFQMKDDPSKRTQFGVIAQEIEPLFPSLVSSGYVSSPEGDPYKMVAYTDFGLIAASGVKELAEIVDAADARIATLESDLAASRAANAALQQSLADLLQRVSSLEAQR